MKNIGKLLLALSFIGNICYADDSTFLPKNTPAPFDGYLLPKEKIQELYNNTIERDTYKKLNDSFKTSLDLEQKNSSLKDDKINLLLQQNDKLAQTAYQSQSLSTWEKIGWFAAGIIVTGLAVKGVHELYR